MEKVVCDGKEEELVLYMFYCGTKTDRKKWPKELRPVAAQKGHLSILQFFLNRKRDKKAADLDVRHGGKTALHWPSENNHAEVVQHLLKLGAGIEEQTGCLSFCSSCPIQARIGFVGNTTLHLASIKVHLEIV